MPLLQKPFPTADYTLQAALYAAHVHGKLFCMFCHEYCPTCKKPFSFEAFFRNPRCIFSDMFITCTSVNSSVTMSRTDIEQAMKSDKDLDQHFIQLGYRIFHRVERTQIIDYYQFNHRVRLVERYLSDRIRR